MKIIDRLEEMSSKDKDISLKLYSLAKDIETKAIDHLKDVIKILPEFTMHDESHSVKVLENIEALLGDDVISSLSCFELFLIHMSAYLHDSGMALPDWEVAMLKLTEGLDEIFLYENSVNHDNKPPYSKGEAKKFIEDRYESLLNGKDNFDKNLGWLFAPKSKQELIKYLC